MKSIRLFALLFSLSLTCSLAHAAEFTGRVLLPDGNPAKEAAIYLDGGATASPMSNAMVDQRNKTFIPHVTVVTRGTRVRFPNNDTVFHNVFAYYDAKKFDLGMYPRGASKTVTFDKTGLVALLCNVHSQMSAFILVVDTPFYAVTDAHGRFKIDHIPSGTYTMHGWHESGAQLTQSVTIDAGATDQTVTLKR